MYKTAMMLTNKYNSDRYTNSKVSRLIWGQVNDNNTLNPMWPGMWERAPLRVPYYHSDNWKRHKMGQVDLVDQFDVVSCNCNWSLLLILLLIIPPPHYPPRTGLVDLPHPRAEKYQISIISSESISCWSTSSSSPEWICRYGNKKAPSSHTFFVQSWYGWLPRRNFIAPFLLKLTFVAIVLSLAYQSVSWC